MIELMKYQFGGGSEQHLAKVHDGLEHTARLALMWSVIDFAVIESVRGKAEQNRYFRLGRSKVEWPNSRHNVKSPEDKAMAFDVAPFVNGEISWNQAHCCVLAGVILAAAAELKVSIRWGGNWDMDGEPVTDQEFQDLVHYEIIGG